MTNMDIHESQSDTRILTEIGERLAQYRLAQGLTQAELARQAGIGKRTLERMEAGAAVQTTSLVRVLRELGLLASLDGALPATGPGPMDLLKRRGKQRQRATGKRSSREPETGPWQWGEE